MNTTTLPETDFPARLKRLSARGWTQMQLAARAGVSQATISELATGKIPDPRHSLARTIEWLDDTGALPPPKERKKAAQQQTTQQA